MIYDVDNKLVVQRIRESIRVKESIADDSRLIMCISEVSKSIYEIIKRGGVLYTCGNGGSASDALHIVGEIVGRFQRERKGFAAVALNADVATMTAIANDYGYDYVFSRQVEALLNDKDILLGISTSGNSKNIIYAFDKARELGAKTVLLTGSRGGVLKDMSDYCIVVPSDNTARIQEGHMCIYHIICEIVERMLTETGLVL